MFEQNIPETVHLEVAREFRINAEAWNPLFKDSRDGKQGLFLPNAGRFDRLTVPSRVSLSRALKRVSGAEGATVRFDVGFARGDVLVNKDPTFGKRIVAVPADQPNAYEVLRQVSLIVLDKMRIEGREVSPNGRVIEDTEFRTNLSAQRWILAHEIYADAAFMERRESEVLFEEEVRYRTIGDMTCTGAVRSKATTVEEIVNEIAVARLTERGATRSNDRASEAAMEDRKKEGYF